MEDNVKLCPVCGCEAAQGASRCPICGVELGAADGAVGVAAAVDAAAGHAAAEAVAPARVAHAAAATAEPAKVGRHAAGATAADEGAEPVEANGSSVVDGAAAPADPAAAPAEPAEPAEPAPPAAAATPAATSYAALTDQPEIAPETAEPAKRGKRAADPYAPARPRREMPRGKKLVALVVAAAVALIAIVAVCVAIFTAASNDAALKDRATSAKQSSASGTVSMALPDKTDEGNYAANIAGGGLVAADSSSRYFALSSGVYRQQGESDADLERICDDSASYLNLKAGKLYFVPATGSNGKPSAKSSSSTDLSGTAIKACKPGESAQVVYEAPSGTTISYLSIWDETMYFVSTSNGTSKLYQLSLSGEGQPKELLSKQCKKLYAYVEQGKLYAITANDSNWTAQRASLGSTAVTFQSWGSGSGSLQAACIGDGSLVYSTKGEHVSRMTATGEMKQIGETSDAPLLLAGSDTLFAFETSGALHMASTTAGLMNDQVSAVDDWLGQQVVANSRAGISGGIMYIASSKGECVACNLVDGTISNVKVG